MATSTVKRTPDVISVDASTTKSVAAGMAEFFIYPTIPSGYKFLALGGVSINYAECSLYQWYWDDANSRVIVRLRNNYAGTLAVDVSATTIFYK